MNKELKYATMAVIALILWFAGAGAAAAGPCANSLNCGSAPLFAADPCTDCTVYACQAARDVDAAYYRQLNTECTAIRTANDLMFDCEHDAWLRLVIACYDVEQARDDCQQAWCTGSGGPEV